MDLIRYSPSRLAGIFDDTFDRLFDPFFDRFGYGNVRSPAIDVKEDENGYTVEAELPGLNEKDLEVKVEGNLLTLSSKKSEEKEEKKKNYLMRERRSYSFSRSFVLPKDVNADKIEAEFKNGLLTLAIPKSEKAKPKLLEIKVK